MIAGSTAGLRFSPVIRLPCRLRQAQFLFSNVQPNVIVRPRHARLSHQRTGVQLLREEHGTLESDTCSEENVCLKHGSEPKLLTRRYRSIKPVLGPSEVDGSLPFTTDKHFIDGIVEVTSRHATNTISDSQDHQDTTPISGFPNFSDTFIEAIYPEQPKNSRFELLGIMARTDSVAESWQAYQSLLPVATENSHEHAKFVIPYTHLHRLARLLASTKPRTRTLFLQLSSVLTTLRNTGGAIHLWEWNALIDCAGKGWRTTSLEDYKAALDIFNSMVNAHSTDSSTVEDNSDDCTQKDPLNPDIVSYTTLLYIAGRSLQPAAIRHASSLLSSSGLPPNRITHLSLLGYFSRTNQLSGVRSTLLKMREQGLPIGLDGINACIWAYAQNRQIDVASTIYRVLRNNFVPEVNAGEHDIDEAINYLYDVEGIIVPKDVIPDEITYTAMIQSLAYHGDLMRALQVFVDMLSSPNLEPNAVFSEESGQPQLYRPTLAAFRGIFIGFVRHGRKPCLRKTPPTLAFRLGSFGDSTSSELWDLNNLHVIFKTFLDLPADSQPSERVIYWIMIAFGKVSGDDPGKLRKIWSQLEKKFGGGWGGRLERLRQKIYAQGGDSKS
ncbi:hypothetical protein SERLA73DRAFT_103500 [Serpula lacrymans var. lacrymans S7.3]|uniref:Pentacotripeptide-repeat region of PRORP domain-containing protein n=2 Tax=Serpula lacrymans var. lacrymans TaxID=341189 RepID=F8PQP5_SERL3|nr:uncharacterized protein SERLADRAFT_360088 [Serpula lacrymans var. lacrymans S7.9]EGO01605.1 hypothetical protein SERLA73DRAFT_103500 [Serpula lacrymans var. lacrymans S7.3]EGO27261.1 hypothetical protein SERLADRAFT_360088 [Serpula lacrymans var. lacrymans S7.9]